MELDLDKVIAESRPVWDAAVDWDLTLAVGGKKRRVKQPTSADILLLTAGKPAEQAATLRGLFDDPPALADPIEVLAVVSGIMTVFGEAAKKKSLASAGPMAAAIRSQMGPANSPGPS